jgi:hypothetical protein
MVFCLASMYPAHVQRSDAPEAEFARTAPVKELRRRLNIGRACISVADIGGEEIKEVFACFVTCSSDDGWHRQARC